MTVLVQSAQTPWGTTTIGASPTVTLGANPTLGNALTLTVSTLGDIAFQYATAVSGGGVTWAPLISSQVSMAGGYESNVEIWAGYNATGGGSNTIITVSLSGGTTISYSGFLGVQEWTPVALDNINRATGLSGTQPSLVITQPNTVELLLTAFISNASAVTSGLTNSLYNGNDTGTGIEAVSYVVTTSLPPGGTQCGYNITAENGAWNQVVVALSGSTVVVPTLQLLMAPRLPL